MNRAFGVGVTGHRWNGLQRADVGQLHRQVRAVLEGIEQELRRLDPLLSPKLLSSLAEGSDRIAASIALDLGYHLHGVVPFARASYQEDFETPESKEEFLTLLARAELVDEPTTVPITPEQREAAYTAAGRRVTVESDILLTIWDGRPERGEGGTGQIVREALARSHPVVWIHAEAPHNAYLPTENGGREGISVLPERIAEIVERRKEG